MALDKGVKNNSICQIRPFVKSIQIYGYSEWKVLAGFSDYLSIICQCKHLARYMQFQHGTL